MKQRITQHLLIVMLGLLCSLWPQLAHAQTTAPTASSAEIGTKLPFRLIEPEFSCPYEPYQFPGMFTFRTVGRDTSAVWYKAIGITGWTKKSGVYYINPACDVEPFTLMAYQESNPSEIITYTWDYKARCRSNCPQQTSTSSVSAVTILDPTYNCSTGEFTFRSSGGDGSQVSYRAVGITDWTTSPGPFIVKPACDVQPFKLQVRQASQPDQVTYRYWDYLAKCSQNCPGSESVAIITYCDQPHVLNGKPLSVSATFTCNTLVGNVPQNLIHVTFSGGVVDPNSVLEWLSIGITPWTNACSTSVDIPSNGDKTFVLQGRQRNIYTGITSATAQTTVTVPCSPISSLGRMGQPTENDLTVQVLGNPTLAESVEVDIAGIVGQQVDMLVTDAQGRAVSQQTIEPALPSQRLRVPLGKAGGLYLLRVSTPSQQKTIKLIRQ